MCRILRQAGASDRVVAMAKNMKCSICQANKPPRTSRVSAITPCMEFNSVVGVDVFHIQGIGNGQNHVLSILDWGPLFHVCVLVKEVTAKRIRKAYRRYWLRVFGPPARLVSDQGKEFTGAEMSERLETDGTHHEVTPTESPWQNGKTERHGGIIKMMVTKARLSINPTNTEELEELIAECCQAKNRYTLVGGFSPCQRVFGTQLRVPGCNMGDEQQPPDISTMSAIESGDPVLMRTMQMRRAAQEAFVFLDSSERVRHAILSGPRPLQQFQPGDLVFFWRRDADVQAFRVEHVHSRWHGPAIVISHFRSKIWVSFRGHLWLCSPEHVRAATNEERMMQDESIAELLDVSRNLSESRARYLQPSGLHEPETSARQVLPGDIPAEASGERADDQLATLRIPQTPRLGRLRQESRGRSPAPERGGGRHRSRSRVQRDDSFWEQVIGDESGQRKEDQVVRQYLEEYGSFFVSDFQSADKLEYLIMMAEQTSTRKRKEILFHRLNHRDQARFKDAMIQEFRGNILRPGASELLSLEQSKEIRGCSHLPRRIVPTRWVFVEQDQGLDQDKSAKARMVVQGYQDPDLGEVEISSPTLHKDSLLMILQMIASFRWTLILADIKGAFMSSRPLQREHGELFASLPKL